MVTGLRGPGFADWLRQEKRHVVRTYIGPVAGSGIGATDPHCRASRTNCTNRANGADGADADLDAGAHSHANRDTIGRSGKRTTDLFGRL